jgi:hypothetical protein
MNKENIFRYLKDEQYYRDLYDRHTVEKCRWWEKQANSQDKEKIKVREGVIKAKGEINNKMIIPLILYFEKGERYAQKEETIKKWMVEDRAKDYLLETAVPPKNINCLGCGLEMFVIHKDFYDWESSKKDRVLFMYDCPRSCVPKRAFFNDGEEWKPKQRVCPKCQGKLRSADEREEKKIITTDICDCGYREIIELDLTVKNIPKESIDENFAKDRERFCLSSEEGGKYISQKATLEQLKFLSKEIEEREKNKDLYGKVAKLKKLNIAELRSLLEPVLEKESYAKLEFSQPRMEKFVTIDFALQDAKIGRVEYDSRTILKRLLEKTLIDTNWRLMSMGITCRLGILSGSFKGYEREDDLKRLIINNSTN